MNPSLAIIGSAHKFTGWGQHRAAVCNGLTKLGIKPVFVPIDTEDSQDYGLLGRTAQATLIIHWPNIRAAAGSRSAIWTMYEGTILPARHVTNLNTFQVVIVPNEWMAGVFRSNGVKRPIEICPLGIDPKLFAYQLPPAKREYIVFGAGGRLAHGALRKGLKDANEWFTAAFPNRKDAVLWIKTSPHCKLNITDDRITIFCDNFTEEQMAGWYAKLDFFVSPAKCECFGLMQHQAMAVGRPVIAAPYAGLAQLVTVDTGYPLPFDLMDADDAKYAGAGKWARPRREAGIESMRYVANNVQSAQVRGIQASRLAHQFTWESSIEKLVEILKRH